MLELTQCTRAKSMNWHIEWPSKATKTTKQNMIRATTKFTL